MHQTVVFCTSFKTEHEVLLSYLNFLNNAVKGFVTEMTQMSGQQFL